MAYWDTSCLVKLYATEPDSARFATLVTAGEAIVISEITRFELWTTLRRKEPARDITSGGARRRLIAYDLNVAGGLVRVQPLDHRVTARFEVLIERCFTRTPPVQLRTLDAIHLATAEDSGESLVVTTDQRMRQAALAMGLRVFPP
jgi:predicted nucleic acid-binding protein